MLRKRPLCSNAIIPKARLEERRMGEFFLPLLYMTGARALLPASAECELMRKIKK